LLAVALEAGFFRSNFLHAGGFSTLGPIARSNFRAPAIISARKIPTFPSSTPILLPLFPEFRTVPVGPAPALSLAPHALAAPAMRQAARAGDLTLPRLAGAAPRL
jgi:hypothetical protein